MLRYFIFLAPFLAGNAFAQERFYVQVPAQLESDGVVRQGIRDECGLESLVGNYVLQSVSEKFPGSMPRPAGTPPQGAKTVNLTILRAYGNGGGGWSGPKTVTVRADLVENGQVVRFLIKRENSRGGVLGGMSGTCYIFERIAQAMGKHIVRWLLSPGTTQSDAVEPRDQQSVSGDAEKS